jgi:hypothetical protein
VKEREGEGEGILIDLCRVLCAVLCGTYLSVDFNRNVGSKVDMRVSHV